jgi:hypothetical protein
LSEPTSGERKVRFSTPDDWTLIEHIGRMQSLDPRRSLKELVDNAIDAFAPDPSYSPREGKKISIELSKNGALNYIKVVDNALGWQSNPGSGKPDFDYSVEHIGDSIKKYLEEYRKARDEERAIGQYALGLLSFWALGKRLVVFSRCHLPSGKISSCSKMTWLRYDRNATIAEDVDPPQELLSTSGCVAIVDQLEKARMTLVTANSLQKYLSRACRTRLMITGVSLEICQSGKRIPVRPMKYEGTYFPVSQYQTSGGFGSIDLEIYLFPPEIEPDEYKVPIFAKGAKVYDDITQIEELNIYPWNAKKVYGQIDYPYGNIAPSRIGFENDSFLNAFIEGMKEITDKLSKQIEEIESRNRKWQRKKFYETFEKTWQEILNRLPEEWRRKEGDKQPIKEEEKKPKVQPGPMSRLEISPQDAQVQCGMVQSFTAKAYDENENLVADPNMVYSWKVEPVNVGILSRDQYRTSVFQAGKKEGIIATITVRAFQYVEETDSEKTIIKTASTNVWLVSQPMIRPSPPPRGDKPPSLEEIPFGSDLHSKYLSDLKVIQVNTMHKDYKAAAERGNEALDKYVNYCYCKEIAVDRWKNVATDPHELSERIADLLAISDLAFNWRELAQKPRGRPSKREG